jgi:hypothetical protein
VVSSLILPLLINEATESEPAVWVRPTVAGATFVVALQAVRTERSQPDRNPPGGLEATISPENLPADPPSQVFAGAPPSRDTRIKSHQPGAARPSSSSAGPATRHGGAGSLPGGSLIDLRSARAARVYDFLLGGANNFEVDRQLAEQLYSSAGGVVNARLRVRANRDFLARAVRYLALEAGVRQFLDLGTGIPNANNVHYVAQAIQPHARTVHVDNDAVVLAHAHSLRNRSPLGAATFVYGDLRHHEMILSRAAQTLDFREPIAVVLVGVLHHFLDDEHPEAMVRRYLDAVPSGSYLVIENIGKESTDVAKLEQSIKACADAQFTLVPRTRHEVVRFFEGTDLVDPGVVFVDDWRPDAAPPAYETRHPCGVGRKP